MSAQAKIALLKPGEYWVKETYCKGLRTRQYNFYVVDSQDTESVTFQAIGDQGLARQWFQHSVAEVVHVTYKYRADDCQNVSEVWFPLSWATRDVQELFTQHLLKDQNSESLKGYANNGKSEGDELQKLTTTQWLLLGAFAAAIIYMLTQLMTYVE